MEENQNITNNENETTDEKLVLWETYSYKQITELLGEKPSGGKKRMLQFARWRKRYDLEPVKGKKYRVTKIRYDVPVAQPPTIDERRTFQNYIYYILLCYMQFQSGNPFNKSSKYTMCFISKKEVQQITGFTNELFLLEGNYDKREEFKENYPSISKEILTEAYEDGYHTIRNTLVSLRRRNMINYAEEIQVSTCDMPYA